MTIEVINVIENAAGVVSLKSFNTDQVSEAEKNFLDCIKENTAIVNPESFLEDGFFAKKDYNVAITWSTIEIKDPIIDAMQTFKTMEGFDEAYREFANKLINSQR